MNRANIGRIWAVVAVVLSALACLYPGVSFTCRPAKGYESYRGALTAFRRDYPQATMADLPGNAWIAGRVLDYLLDPKYACPVQENQICIIGHSRYGKQSLIAAALDERITSVVARSPGSPGSCPYRFTSRNTFAETSVDFPGDWFLPNLRTYYGRENELPIDAHGWLGLIAPRRCLIHTAHNDGCEPTFAVERAYREGSEVYRFLGKPEKIAWDGQYTFLTEAESAMMTHDRWRARDTARMPVSFGANVRGNIYYNPKNKTPAPVVIWMHPYSYHSGYNEGYGCQGAVYSRMAQKGFVVLAFDQCGFGLRLLEGRDFYEAYPKWSRLGRMVHDVSAAVDFLVDGKGKAQGTLPAVDKGQVYVLGYSVGGMVGLYAAALDERITGVASFCGFTPLRTDTDEKHTGGLRRFWEWHALQPLMGTFHGRERNIPYDFDDVLALIAPRPCLVYSPKRDREADYEDVALCIERARQAWKANGRGDNFTHQAPDDINRFQADQQNAFLQWAKGL